MTVIVATHTAKDANDLHILLNHSDFEAGGNPFIGEDSEYNKAWYWLIKDGEAPIRYSYYSVIRMVPQPVIYSLDVYKIKLNASRENTGG